MKLLKLGIPVGIFSQPHKVELLYRRTTRLKGDAFEVISRAVIGEKVKSVSTLFPINFMDTC